MRMLQTLEHIQLIQHHALVALNVLLEYDLDGNTAHGAICFSHDAIRSCAEGATESILGPVNLPR